MKYTPTLLLLALAPAAALAQANAIIPNSDPEIERKSFIVAPGFEVNLFAADPLLAKPIQMNFDPQGRLWVATSELYPQIKPGEKANDKIIVLEDTDGDGRADKTTVFADGLLIPTGIEPGDGGAYVANSTELIHLRASKPGGKADSTRVMLSGFGTEDTHHIIHTFRWGPDCALYFNQSIYIHSHIETPFGVKRLNAGGIWRYRPEVNDLNVFARGWVNSWGHHFDKYGQSFVTDGAGGEGINHAVPGASYMTAANASRILHGLNPGSPKHCGLEIVSGRHLPDDWQGDMITNDFRGHRVCRFKLRDDGSSYESREQGEVIKTNHPAFRPIDVKMGPDGAIYVADWYNPIIQHGEVDFRDPRRDHTHGRIWRITAKGRPLVPRPNLVAMSTLELLEQLKSPEGWTRQQAKRVLKERGHDGIENELVKTIFGQPIRTEAGPALTKWYESIPAADERTRLEAGWVYQALGIPAPQIIEQLLKANDPGVRAAAVRMAATYQDRVPTQRILPWVEPAVGDDNPRVRMEAVRALVEPTAAADVRAAETALRLLDKPMDRTLDYALWLTLRELERVWLPAFVKGDVTFGSDVKKIAFALEASGSAAALKPLLSLIDSGSLTADQSRDAWVLLARVGGPGELGRALERSGDASVPEATRAAVVQAVEDNVRRRRVGPPPKPRLAELMRAGSPTTRHAAIRLAGLWKLAEYRDELERRAADEKADTGDRRAAFEAVVGIGGPQARVFLDNMTGTGVPDVTRRMATAAMVVIDTPAAAKKAADVLATAAPAEDAVALFAAFLQQKAAPPQLAAALAGKTIPADTAKFGLKAIRASGQPHPALVEALTKAGNLTAARKDPTPDEVRQYVADVSKLGDPARGEQVFRRKELQCLNCHAIAGVGGQVGPDVTSIGASAQPDYLVESLLLPNKAIKEGYHAVQATDLSGRTVTGVKVRDTDKELVLRTAEDKEVVIPKADLDGPVKQSPSLMPAGLTDPLTRGEFVDLVRFLSELGKLGPYSVSKARLVRRWEVIEPTNANLDRFRRARVSAVAETPAAFGWVPAYSTVAGKLDLADAPTFVVWNQSEPQSVARFQLNVTAGGPARLKFNSVAGLTLYVGPTAVEPKADTLVDVKPGTTLVTVLVDRTKRTASLLVELDDVPGSPARVAVAGGK